MKNLTTSSITILRADNSRVHLAAASVVPRLVLRREPAIVQQGALEIITQALYEVDFTGVDLDAERGPFIVEQRIFDALPAHRTEFVTPDHQTAILNGLKVPHLIRRFIGKPGFQPSPRSLQVPAVLINNQ